MEEVFRIVHWSDWIHLGQVSVQNEHLGSILDQFSILGFYEPCMGSIWTLHGTLSEPCMGSIWTLHGTLSGPCMGLILNPAWGSFWTLYGCQSGPCMDLNLDPAWI